ncbi:MAG TPA: hypothetical protein VMU82_04960, partial [Acetobacteraceae bacterium]|nr:hypothetical protein [Acetobacteraceae bacterium]
PDLAALQAEMTDLVLRTASEQADACCRFRQELLTAFAPAMGAPAADDPSNQTDAAPLPPRKPAAAAPAA